MLTLTKHTLAAGQRFDRPSHEKALRAVLPKSKILTVWRDERLAAYAYLWPKDAGLWFVGGFAVHPEHRNGKAVIALFAKL